MSSCLTSVVNFLDSEVSSTIVETRHLEQVDDYAVKVRKIREMLSRDRMKVAFFGR